MEQKFVIMSFPPKNDMHDSFFVAEEPIYCAEYEQAFDTIASVYRDETGLDLVMPRHKKPIRVNTPLRSMELWVCNTPELQFSHS